MINPDLENFFPTIYDTLDRLSRHEIHDLHALDWEMLADEICMCYIFRDNEWQVDESPDFITDPHTLPEPEDDCPKMLGLHVFLGTLDDTETNLRLMDACAWHIDLLASAIKSDSRSNWLKFLVLTLVEGTGQYVTQFANTKYETELKPAILAEAKADVLARMKAAVDGYELELKDKQQQTLLSKMTWLCGHSVWSRITAKAHEDNRAQEIDLELRSLCQNADAPTLCGRLDLRYKLGYLDLIGLGSKKVYDSLTDFYGPLRFTCNNFGKYYKKKV